MLEATTWVDDVVEDLEDIIAPDDKVSHFAAGVGIGLALITLIALT